MHGFMYWWWTHMSEYMYALITTLFIEPVTGNLMDNSKQNKIMTISY